MAQEEGGVVKKWFAEKGYGFIAPDHGMDCFAHFTAVADGEQLEEGQRVYFVAEDQPGGRRKAVSVRRAA